MARKTDPEPSGDSLPRGLKTREVLLATGITHQILYRYVTLGLIEEAKTTPTGQRLFDPQTIPAIRLIQRLNQTGYTLRDIKDIFFKDERLRNAQHRSHRLGADEGLRGARASPASRAKTSASPQEGSVRPPGGGVAGRPRGK